MNTILRLSLLRDESGTYEFGGLHAFKIGLGQTWLSAIVDDRSRMELDFIHNVGSAFTPAKWSALPERQAEISAIKQDFDNIDVLADCVTSMFDGVKPLSVGACFPGFGEDRTVAIFWLEVVA